MKDIYAILAENQAEFRKRFFDPNKNACYMDGGKLMPAGKYAHQEDFLRSATLSAYKAGMEEVGELAEKMKIAPWNDPNIEWVCEEHPHQEQGHKIGMLGKECGGAGMPKNNEAYVSLESHNSALTDLQEAIKEKIKELPNL